MRRIGSILLILCLLWTGFIFSRSMKSGEESSKESGRILALVEKVFDLFGLEAPSEHFIRKTGHFVEYAVLGAFAGMAGIGLSLRFWGAVGLGYSFSVALIDELTIQRFSEGRGPSFGDAMLDTAGAFCALFLIFAVVLIKKRKNDKKISQKP